ncbi:MAG: response regulator [Nitrospiraceae bacterium]
MTDFRPILLVEDDPNDAELTLEALAEYHLINEVVTVRDGAQALDLFYGRGQYRQRTPCIPAVVLLDLHLPKIDGLEVLHSLRADPRLMTVPVIILTGSRAVSDFVESNRMGVSAYLEKPLNFFRLSEAILKLGLRWAVFDSQPTSR